MAKMNAGGSQEFNETPAGNEEEQALRNNIEHFKSFLKQLELRGEEGLSSGSQDLIKEIENDMAGYLKKKHPVLEAEACQMSKGNVVGQLETKPKGDKEYQEGDSSGKRVILKKGSTHSEESDESPSSTFESSDTEGEEVDKQGRRKAKRKPPCDLKEETSINELDSRFLKLLHSLDNRPIPKQEPFDEASGQDLKQYLVQFEEYCTDNFKGRKYLWIPELERHLSGKILEGFQSMRDYHDSYDEVRRKLLDWYKDSKHLRRGRAKRKFENAKMKSNEALFIFGNRLESLFRTAFPSHRVNESRTLINKFLENVPKSVKTEIKSQIMTFKLKNEKVKWSFVLKCARLKDNDCDSRKSEETDEEKPEEVIINFGNSHDLRCKDQYSTINNPSHHGRAHVASSSYRPINQTARYGNPPTSSWCNICHRFGHSIENCRQRLKRCFACGDANHFVRDCHIKPPWNQRYRTLSRRDNLAYRDDLQRNDRPYCSQSSPRRLYSRRSGSQQRPPCSQEKDRQWTKRGAQSAERPTRKDTKIPGQALN